MPPNCFVQGGLKCIVDQSSILISIGNSQETVPANKTQVQDTFTYATAEACEESTCTNNVFADNYISVPFH